MKHPPVQYHSYLRLDSLLGSQSRRSAELGNPIHDEWLFITIHQAYELWFKQIVIELDSVIEMFSADTVPENRMRLISERMERINEIAKLMIHQVDVLETLTPLDFLEFRDYLFPASGFQSFQFRMIETKLGLKEKDRLKFMEAPFYKSLTEPQQKIIIETLDKPSLLTLLEKWLERTPVVTTPMFDFIENYKRILQENHKSDLAIVQMNPRLTPEEKAKHTAGLQTHFDTLFSLFDEQKYENLKAQGIFKVSRNAMIAALMIQLYRDEPLFQWPYRLMSSLLDLDEGFTQWRYRHALMAHRMLGFKIGTGGSKGHEYLRNATEAHKIFTDFFNLSSFLVPRSQLPPLPEVLKKRMNYGG
ncbi:MAG: tryptophan 2,3-dioxygenase family protein [Bdellovibrionota bacterium]